MRVKEMATDPVETLDPLLDCLILLEERHTKLLREMEDAPLDLAVVRVRRTSKSQTWVNHGENAHKYMRRTP